MNMNPKFRQVGASDLVYLMMLLGGSPRGADVEAEPVDDPMLSYFGRWNRPFMSDMRRDEGHRSKTKIPVGEKRPHPAQFGRFTR